jgi:hypothetical protein
MRVRLVQIDGTLPNLALMSLSAWHQSQGHEVVFTRSTERRLDDGHFDRVYASAIFRFSAPKIQRMRQEWPEAIIAGTGTDNPVTVEELIGGDPPPPDYSLYPEYAPSLGFTQRGCRLKCGFCVVPKKEGANRAAATIADIYRGEPHPRTLHLLDNDLFGQPRAEWEARIAEIRDGGFRVCINQGINVRKVTPAEAEALAGIEYRDDQFKRRRLYTAWDNLGDEAVFLRGVETLAAAGVPPTHLMTYMLVGYDRRETWPRIWQRFDAMVARGIRPYPMVFDCRATDPARYHELKRFQRWVVTGLYRAVPFSEYDAGRKAHHARPGQMDLFEDAA